jgi:hypothetical protein
MSFDQLLPILRADNWSLLRAVSHFIAVKEAEINQDDRHPKFGELPSPRKPV